MFQILGVPMVKGLLRAVLVSLLCVPVLSMADEAPVIEFVGDRQVEVAQTLGINVFAYSSRSGVPWLWVESLPEGAEFFDRGEGYRTFLWYPGSGQLGEHTITFIAADAQDQSLRTEMDVTITVLPGSFTSPAFSIVAPSSAEAIVGQVLSVKIAAIDSDGTVPALFAESMPEGASLDDNGDGTRTFIWNPTSDDIGDHLIRFVAIPANYPNFSTSHDLWISVTTRAPLVSFPVSPGVVAGNTLSFPISATKPSGHVPALFIDNLPDNASFTDNGDGTRQFVWETTENDIGIHSFTVTALDPVSGASSNYTIYVAVHSDPSLTDGEQIVVIDDRVESLDIENVDLVQNFDDSMNIVNAEAGFMIATTDLIINDSIRVSIALRPGLNRIVLESVQGSQRIVLNIERLNYPSILYPSIGTHAVAVDVDDSTIAIGDTLYELQGSAVVSEHFVGSAIDVSYVTSIDVSDNTVALASRERAQEGVWLYERVDGVWEFDQHITPDPARHPDGMGSVVALDGDTLAVSAVYDSGSSPEQMNDAYSPGSGAVIIYERSGDAWQYSATLRSSNPETNDYFGHSLALEGETLVVGAVGEDSNATGINGDQANNDYRSTEHDLYSAGAAYVFERHDGDWLQSAYLKPSSNVIPHIGFGHAVAVFEDTIAVAAIDAPRPADENMAVEAFRQGESTDYYRVGNVFIYKRGNSGWSQSHRLGAPADNWRFGLDIDLKSDQLLILTQTRAYFHELYDNDWQLIWDEDVGASVTAFNHESMVFAMGNNRARVYTSQSLY